MIIILQNDMLMMVRRHTNLVDHLRRTEMPKKKKKKRDATILKVGFFLDERHRHLEAWRAEEES